MRAFSMPARTSVPFWWSSFGDQDPDRCGSYCLPAIAENSWDDSGLRGGAFGFDPW